MPQIAPVFVALGLNIALVLTLLLLYRRAHTVVTVLKEREEHYAYLTEVAFEGIIFSESEVIRDLNKRLAAMLGYEREELIGRPIDQIVASESRDLVRQRGQAGYEGSYECLALRKDGHVFPIELRSRSFQDQDRALRVTVVLDISEHVAIQHALAQSELRFRGAFHANPTPQILTSAADGTFLDVNAAYERLTGWSRDELLGKRTTDFPLWVDLDRADLMADLATTGRLSDRPAQARDKAGVLHDLILSIEPLQVGEVSCLLSVMIDITARKRAEEELRLLQTTALAISATKDLPAALAVTLQQVCEATGWVLGQAWVAHPGAAVLACSAAWSGTAPELEPFRQASTGTILAPGVGLPGRVWQKQRALWIQDVTRDTNFLRASFAQEAGLKAAMAFPVLAGADIVAVLEFFVREPRPEDAQLIKLISTVAAQLGTVIQRKQAEDALRASEERYRRIVETAEEGIWVLDRANITTFVNPKLAHWLGYTVDEMIGQSVFGFLTEEEQARVAEHLEHRRLGFREQYEVRLCRKDGTPLWAIVSASPIEDQQGGYAGAFAMLTDITARKQAEALRAGQSQLLEMIATNAALEDVLVSLIRLIEAQSEGLLCSILLLDEDGQHVRHAAAPSLPEAYTRAIDGLPIGPAAGSCGTAMYRREPVIVTDILQDPLWVEYRDLAAPYGLRACWSTPIVSHEGQVFGSFAMYYREVRSPSPAELRLNEIAVRIAGIAIERKRIEDEVRKQKERLQKIFDHVPIMITLYDEDGRLALVNREWERTFGWTLEELDEQDLDLFVECFPDSPQRQRARDFTRTAGGEWADFKVRVRSGRVIDMSGAVVRVSDGTSISIAQDITERKQAEEKLRQSESHLAEAQRLAHIGSWSRDEHTDTVTWSDEVYRMYGVRPSEFGHTYEAVTAFTHPEDRDMFERSVETGLKTHEPFHFYYRIIRPDGEERVIHVRGAVETDEHGNPTRVYGAAQDVTEIKQAEDELRKQKEKLQKIFDHVPLPINFYDENGRLALVNREWERTFGWTLEELDEQHLDIVAECFPDARERQRVRDFLTVASGEWSDFKLTVRDGRVLDVWGTVIRVSDGTRIGLTQDITERKRAEEELRKHREHLEELVKERTAELAVAKDKAEESDRLKSAFLATMSHELRTPLNAIIGFTGIMLQGLVGPLNDEQQKQLAMVKSSAHHLLNLINEVLDLSKIEAGQVELKLETFGMRTAIHRTIQTLAPLAAKKQLTLMADVAPEVDRLTSDQRRVEQVLLNLVTNAIKFTERGEVRIECRVRGGQLLTSVADTGIGIKPEEIGKLFTIFQQLDSTLARKHEGTGLGLAICKKLVEMLGGAIEVESVWGSGSVFTFALPLNKQAS